MIYAAHATARNGTMSRIEVEATSRQDACAQVFSRFPPCSLESVCAWPVRGEARVTLDALSLRISANPIYGASFGAIV